MKKVAKTMKLTLNEAQLTKLVSNIATECVKRLNEGIYDYPDTIDQIILCAENDRECYDISWQLVQSLMKKVRKGVELSADQLSNSSWMKKFQQFCFRKFKQYQEDYDKDTSPKLFRDWWAEKMIDDVNNEIEYERRNTEKSEQ